jgi:hypothetical protein
LAILAVVAGLHGTASGDLLQSGSHVLILLLGARHFGAAINQESPTVGTDYELGVRLTDRHH